MTTLALLPVEATVRTVSWNTRMMDTAVVWLRGTVRPWVRSSAPKESRKTRPRQNCVILYFLAMETQIVPR
jgi:hypothetical protein